MTEKNNRRKFLIKESTRQRCKIWPYDEKTARRFAPVSLELFSYLREVSAIDFSLFIVACDEIIEFIKPNELSAELLEQMWQASIRPGADIDICVLKADLPKFEALINQVRNKKIRIVLEKDRTLDARVLELYSSLSSASQMIVRGGINNHVANKAIDATASIMSSQIDSDIAVGTLSRMISCDSTLYDHSASVAMLSATIAMSFLKNPLSREECQIVAQCGLYHDAGKSCVPNHVLNKPGSFTPEEFEIMKTHTILGYEELRRAIDKGAPVNELAARVAMEHHERFKGRGYPHGKKGRLEDHAEGIHLYTRIISVADVYSALLMKRVYKAAMSSTEAIELMTKNADDDFDPEIFYPFCDHIRTSIEVFREREKQSASGSVRMISEKESFSEALRNIKTERKHKS
ncbi:MAG: HD domain-containing protein [Deltaproteobacteria bacterium]|nr:HD domain-containing protein [Deltaproteobacteria bacterium]